MSEKVKCFSSEFVPIWVKPNILRLDYELEPLYKKGIFKDGIIDGCVKVKAHDRAYLSKGVGECEVYYVLTKHRHQENYWAREIYLHEPMPNHAARIETAFRLGDRGLSLEEAIMLRRILYIFQTGKEVFYSSRDQRWVMPIVWKKIREVLPVSRASSIKTFKRFTQVFWLALHAAGPLPRFSDWSFLREIFENWGRGQIISFTPDVVEGLEQLAPERWGI